MGAFHCAPRSWVAKNSVSYDNRIAQNARHAMSSENRQTVIFNVLPLAEFACGMGCTPEEVEKQESDGKLFSVLSFGTIQGRSYPRFQLDSALDMDLLKEILFKYREADVGYAKLWSFLRAPQKQFSDKTVLELLLGEWPPAYDVLSATEKTCELLEVVDEELSRVRW